MIIFTIAFGEPYISRLFDRCLPSLMARPLDIAEPLALHVFTTEAHIANIERRLRSAPAVLMRNFAQIELWRGRFEEGADARSVSAALLRDAAKTCVENNEIFALAAPDTVYGSATLQNCYDLHQATGKNIAFFNGRIAGDFNNAELLTHARTEMALVNFFFANMDAEWRANCARAIGEMPGNIAGNLALDTPRLRTIFCATPNPFVGRFQEHDILNFTETFRVWDHAWARLLEADNRLLVNTNLDAAFSIEPEEELSEISRYKVFNDLAGAIDGDLRRKFKFGPPTYLFTTATRPLS